jgi:hypothetical protein
MRAQRQVALRGSTALTHRRSQIAGTCRTLSPGSPARLPPTRTVRDLTRRRWASRHTYVSGGGVLHRYSPRGPAPAAAIERNCGP